MLLQYHSLHTHQNILCWILLRSQGCHGDNTCNWTSGKDSMASDWNVDELLVRFIVQSYILKFVASECLGPRFAMVTQMYSHSHFENNNTNALSHAQLKRLSSILHHCRSLIINFHVISDLPYNWHKAIEVISVSLHHLTLSFLGPWYNSV